MYTSSAILGGEFLECVVARPLYFCGCHGWLAHPCPRHCWTSQQWHPTRHFGVDGLVGWGLRGTCGADARPTPLRLDRRCKSWKALSFPRCVSASWR